MFARRIKNLPILTLQLAVFLLVLANGELFSQSAPDTVVNRRTYYHWKTDKTSKTVNMRFFEATAATGSEYIGLRAPYNVNASYTLILPIATGTSGQALVLVGTDSLGWGLAGGGGSLTIREADGSPSISAATTLEFLQSTGLKFTDQGSNVGRVELDTSTVWINTKTEIATQITNAITQKQDDSDTTGFDASKTWVLSKSYLVAADIAQKQDDADTNTFDASKTWVLAKNYLTAETGDISAVTAGYGLAGGGSSGAVTLTVDSTTVYLQTKTENNALYVPLGRTITAGNGLVGGSSLNANIVLDVIGTDGIKASADSLGLLLRVKSALLIKPGVGAIDSVAVDSTSWLPSKTWVLNKSYLTSSDIAAYQQDSDTTGFDATKTYVNAQGFIKVADSSATYLQTKTENNSLYQAKGDTSTYDASKTWVLSKNYLVANDIAAYQQDSDTTGFDASKTWVLNKGYLTSETGDISAVVAGDGLIGGATTGSATVDVNPKRFGAGRLIVTSDSLLVDANSIDSTRVTDGALTTIDYRVRSITGAKIGLATVDSVNVANLVSTDIVDGSLLTADLANSAITGAKIAANTITGDKIALGSDAQGDVMYYNGTDWVRLGAGTTGQVLHTQGAGANPIWDTDDGAGGGAPTDAQYLTLALNGSLSAERVVVGATNNISLNDAGANGNLTIGLASTLDFAAKVVLNDTILVAEGTSADGFETHFTIDNPTADREINWPDADGEVTVLGNSSTGTGGVVREGSPTITTPTIADLTNMNHIHQGVTSGGYFVGSSFIRAQNNTDAASNQVAQFQSGDRATAADNDEGYFSFYNDNDGGTQTEFSRLSWLATDVTAATKDAAFTFDIMSANSLTEVLRIQSSAAGTITVNVPNGTLQQGGTAVTLQDRTITVAGTTNEITSSAGAQDFSANRTWTLSLPATIDLGGKTSFEIPNAAAPTTDAFGEIAGDDNAYATGRGAAQFYDGTTSTWLVGFPTTETKTDGYIPKYIAATGRWRLAPDSTTAGGGTAWDAIADAAGLGSISFAGFDQDITSAEDGGDILTIINSDADRASDSNILVLADDDGGDANAFYLRMIGDADGTPTNDFLFSQTSFSVGSGIAASFASASSLTVPTSGGAAPTTDGSIAYDNTADRYTAGGTLGGSSSSATFVFPRVLSSQGTSSILDAGTIGTAETNFDITYNFPANYFTAGKVVRVFVQFEIVSPGTAVSHIYKLRVQKSGPTNVNFYSQVGGFTPAINSTLQMGMQYLIRCESTGASGTVSVSSLAPSTASQANPSNIDNPITFDTTAAQTLQFTITFGGNTSGNTTQIRQMLIEDIY